MSVFDASAMVALLKNEPGADVVADILARDVGPFYAHSANLCEVFHIVWRRDGESAAHAALANLTGIGIVERDDMDGVFWRDAGSLIATWRLAKASLPLGDALGVALARRLGAEFVTSDRHEIEPLHTANLVKARFIR